MSGLYHMTEDQQSLVELIRDFMNREIKPHVLEWEKEGHYPQEIIQMGIDMGLHMMQVPEEYGGMGLDTTTTAMMGNHAIRRRLLPNVLSLKHSAESLTTRCRSSVATACATST